MMNGVERERGEERERERRGRRERERERERQKKNKKKKKEKRKNERERGLKEVEQAKQSFIPPRSPHGFSHIFFQTHAHAKVTETMRKGDRRRTEKK